MERVEQSFKYEELDPAYEISTYSGTFVHYLEQIQMDLEQETAARRFSSAKRLSHFISHLGCDYFMLSSCFLII